jgi:hypothetical protein
MHNGSTKAGPTGTLPPDKAVKLDNSLPPSVICDLEKNSDYTHLGNVSVRNYAWENVSVTVKDSKTKLPKTILNKCSGIVNAGEMLAIMGPR